MIGVIFIITIINIIFALTSFHFYPKRVAIAPARAPDKVKELEQS